MTNIKIKVDAKSLQDSLCRDIFILHLQTLPNDVMPNFGIEFNKRYIQNLISNGGHVLTAFKKGELVGFILLSNKKYNIFKIISLQSLLIFFFKTLFKPIILFKLIKHLLNSISIPSNSSEISYFGVKNNYRGKGIGKKLIKKAETLTKSMDLIHLMTKTSNKSLYDFYTVDKKAKILGKYKVFNETFYNIIWKI